VTKQVFAKPKMKFSVVHNSYGAQKNVYMTKRMYTTTLWGGSFSRKQKL
jgi:hypothetical protein